MRKKHLRSIEQNYRRAFGFGERFERLAAQYQSGCSVLPDLCYAQLKFWLSELAIKTPVLRASELAVSGSKSQLVLSLCQEVGGTSYLSGPLGRGYLDETSFKASGIEVRYHDFQHPQYTQLYGEFVPAMAVVDYWMNSSDLGLFAGAA